MPKDAWAKGYQETQAKYLAQLARESRGGSGTQPTSGAQKSGTQKS